TRQVAGAEATRVPEAPGARFGIIGSSPGIVDLYAVLERVADTTTTVLITGESGTGKELVARALHDHSSRKDKPFIKVNCAAIPKELIESELFGYEKGAFTGAVNSKPGRFELADAGTLFLDEIGTIPLEMQVKLLRALQESEFERVGGVTTTHVNVRLIAATNSDLAAEAAPATPHVIGPLKEIVRQHTENLEKSLIMRALEETGGNVTKAARRLEISRKSLQNKMKELGLRGQPSDEPDTDSTPPETA